MQQEEVRSPAACKRKRAAPSVLQLQLFITAGCIAAVLAARWFAAPHYQALRSAFEMTFAAEAGETELVRFAQALLDSISLQADAAAAPEGCSNKSYLPEQEVALPLETFYVSSEYGWRTHPISGEKSFHNGMDLAADEGSPIAAVMDGMVQSTGSDSLSGNYVILRHADGVVTSYCHMQFVFVRAGEFLQAGQQIGTVGQTGSATGPHLHLCLKYNGVRYDPAAMLGLA